MSKRQINTYLVPELCEHLAALEEETGASRTRIVSAALIAFMADGGNGNSVWFRFATRLDKGKITLSGLLQEIREEANE